MQRKYTSTRRTLKNTRLKGGKPKENMLYTDENSMVSWISMIALVGLGTWATLQHLSF